MRLSDEKIKCLSHILIEHIMKDDNFDIFAEENEVRLEILKVIIRELEIGEGVDQRVREKFSHYSRPIIEGTAEWNLLYKKMHDEELNKMGRL